MRITLAVVVATGLLGASPEHGRRSLISTAGSPEHIATNDNRTPAGTLHDGLLTIRLEIREGEWHPDGETDPSIVVRAFAEADKPASIPGPLIRVPEGTEIHAFVRNTLRDSTIVVHGFRWNDADTMQIAPGAVREVHFVAGSAGTFYYWAATSGDIPTRGYHDAELSGAFIVDPRGTSGPPADRVFVIGLWDKGPQRPGGVLATGDILRFTINGKSWPNTERLTYAAGDTVRFRVVNASFAPHPMHLHGFYFTVESRGDGARDSTYGPRAAPYRVVTERLRPGRTFTMSWVPDRPGNWLFHCHDNGHVLRNIPLDGSSLPAEQDVHAHNHALEMMGGLVMGIEVRDNGVVQAASEPAVQRRLRLVARAESGGTLAEPSFGYVLQDGEKARRSGASLLPAPTILLKRGEPVGITIVNELPEPTSVHWHGIELDSYYDGVADFSGHPGRIPHAIAPRDSFEARFTPPRSGTFMYHPHADELRQQRAGMAGALIVLDDPRTFDPDKDIVLLLTIPRSADDRGTILLNGTNAPAARELRVGERYRLRLVDIHPLRPSMIARLLRDSALVTWRAIAKDGMDVPPERATVRPAIQQMGNGETYDFELIPDAPGDLRFTVTSAVGALLVSMPIRVRP